MYRIIPLICVFPFLLSGCLMLPSALFDIEPEQRTVYVPVAEPVVQKTQMLELTVIDGKTTKQEIINAIGTPDTMLNGTDIKGRAETNMIYYFQNYDPNKDKVFCRIKLIEKDGTVWNEVLGQGKFHSVLFTIQKGVVQSTTLL